MSNYFDYFDKISDIFQSSGTNALDTTKLEISLRIPPHFKNLLPPFMQLLLHFAPKLSISSKCQVSFIHFSCFFIYNIHTLPCTSIDFKQLAKSVWKLFKVEFQDIENRLSDQHDIIEQEICLASETITSQVCKEMLIY